ncbi:MAG: hypothetical protein E6778_06650 [Niallia nealsonii]|nr:hypothetical protein [Niallia nealsonii]
MSERLEMIKEYYRKNRNDKVLVTVPPTKSVTTKGTVIRYFEGSRIGYWFKNGQAWVEKKDVYKFRQSFPHFIIHDEEEVLNNDSQ